MATSPRRELKEPGVFVQEDATQCDEFIRSIKFWLDERILQSVECLNGDLPTSQLAPPTAHAKWLIKIEQRTNHSRPLKSTADWSWIVFIDPPPHRFFFNLKYWPSSNNPSALLKKRKHALELVKWPSIRVWHIYQTGKTMVLKNLGNYTDAC